jgi:pimeloyl-ACP methyl ester carboxylesterase
MNSSLTPTAVLVHGSFEDASIWRGVIQRLQRDGYPVVAPGNPLRGVPVDAAYLRSVVDRIQGPVLLVAHSYGGAVITEAGADDPKVKGLVYASAVMPAVGETCIDVIKRFPGSSFLSSVEEVPYALPDGTSGMNLVYQAGKFHSQVAADVPASEAALMEATQRSIDASALMDVLTAAAWTTKPSWQVATTEDLAIPLAEQRFEAARAHSHVTEVAASHAVTVSQPGVVADVIEQAVRAIAG